MADYDNATEEKDEAKVPTLEEAEPQIVAFALACLEEADQAKQERLKKNQINWAAYNGEMDWAHKEEGDATIYLHKVALAVEQLTSVFKGSMTNFDEFVEVERLGDQRYSDDERAIFDGLFTDRVVKAILQHYLDRAEGRACLGDAFKNGLQESRSTLHVSSEMRFAPRFVNPSERTLKAVEDYEWQPILEVLPATRFYLDPFSDLYSIREIHADRAELLDMTIEADPKHGIYDEDKVLALPCEEMNESEEEQKRNEGDETVAVSRNRHRFPVTVYEGYFKAIYDKDGKVLKVRVPKGKKEVERELRNVIVTFSKTNCLLHPPMSNPHWHGQNPYVSATPIRVGDAAWPKAIMDASVQTIESMSELISLMTDGALKKAHNILAIRPDYLEDPAQAEGGIPAGATIRISGTAPANAKVIEPVETGDMPIEALQLYNALDGIQAENVMTNQVNLGGMPSKQVRATEVIQANQAISGIFDSLAADFEDVFISPAIHRFWTDILQNIDEFPVEDLLRIVGNDAGGKNATRLQAINDMTRQQRFRIAAHGFKFKAVGIKTINERLKDFQRVTQYLATVGQNPEMFAEFKRRFSLPALHEKILRSLGLNPSELTKTPDEIEHERQLALIRQQALAMAENGLDQGAPEAAGPGRQPASIEEPTQGTESDTGEAEPGSGMGLM